MKSLGILIVAMFVAVVAHAVPPAYSGYIMNSDLSVTGTIYANAISGTSYTQYVSTNLVVVNGTISGNGLSVTYGVSAATAAITTVNATTGNITTVTATTVTPGTLAGATAVTGVQTISAMPVWTMTATDVTVTSPTVAGQWCRTAAYDVYISSGIGTLTSWKKITN